MINHLENLKSLCTKTGLIKSLRKFYKHTPEPLASNYCVQNTTPTTYIVTASCQDSEFSEFARRFHELELQVYNNEKLPVKHCLENMWLVKPAAENQGRGIEVFKNDFLGIKRFLQSKSITTHWIIQKYIERPLLYYGRKFDIRMWAIMTGKKEFYVYNKGYVRTSSDSYTTNTNANYVHLTNNCLQQFGDKYGTFEDGNTVSLKKFEEYLKEEFPHLKINFNHDLLRRMKDLMIDTYLATKNEFNPKGRANCFELLGYDFMIDED